MKKTDTNTKKSEKIDDLKPRDKESANVKGGPTSVVRKAGGTS